MFDRQIALRRRDGGDRCAAVELLGQVDGLVDKALGCLISGPILRDAALDLIESLIARRIDIQNVEPDSRRRPWS